MRRRRIECATLADARPVTWGFHAEGVAPFAPFGALVFLRHLSEHAASVHRWKAFFALRIRRGCNLVGQKRHVIVHILVTRIKLVSHRLLPKHGKDGMAIVCRDPPTPIKIGHPNQLNATPSYRLRKIKTVVA